MHIFARVFDPEVSKVLVMNVSYHCNAIIYALCNYAVCIIVLDEHPSVPSGIDSSGFCVFALDLNIF